MGRKNHRRGTPQAQSRRRGLPPPPPLQALIIPVGKCYSRSTKPKLQFTREQAPKALEQARATRARRGQTENVEKRFYECPACGFFHLTKREEFQERGQG